MFQRTTVDQLRWPGSTPGHQSAPPSAQEIRATLALFDAIAMDHEVLVAYALAQGARLDAQVMIDQKPVGVLESAVHHAVWYRNDDGKMLLRTPDSAYRSKTVDVLIDAGAKDRHALMAFVDCKWFLDSGNKPLHDPMVVAVEKAGLDAMLNEQPGSDAFRFLDEGKNPLTARGRFFGKMHESWLAVAARHRRPDVIQHWFTSGGTLNAPKAMLFISPLVAMLEPPPPGIAIAPEDAAATQALLTEAWMNAPKTLYRQEVLHLVVARTQWSDLLKQQRGATPADRDVVERIDRTLTTALETRPIDLRLTPAESEAVKSGTRLALVEKALPGFENAVLRHALRNETATAEKARPRARL